MLRVILSEIPKPVITATTQAIATKTMVTPRIDNAEAVTFSSGTKYTKVAPVSSLVL